MRDKIVALTDNLSRTDVKFIAPHVLSHRLIVSNGRQPHAIMERLLRSQVVEPELMAA